MLTFLTIWLVYFLNYLAQNEWTVFKFPAAHSHQLFIFLEDVAITITVSVWCVNLSTFQDIQQTRFKTGSKNGSQLWCQRFFGKIHWNSILLHLNDSNDTQLMKNNAKNRMKKQFSSAERAKVEILLKISQKNRPMPKVTPLWQWLRSGRCHFSSLKQVAWESQGLKLMK